MTVSSGYAPNTSTANGVTTVFPYNFRILAAADLEVSVDGVVKTLTTDYSVSGVGAAGGGNVTFVAAPANGSAVIRRRNMALVRTTDYQDNGDLLADVLNPDQDAPVLMVQQTQEQVDRSLKFPLGDSANAALPSAALRAKKGLGFDLAGNPIVFEVDAVGLAASVTQAAASATVSTTQSGIAVTQAGIATAQAGIATTQAGLATTARTAAETARDAALAAARIFATTAAGLAATTSGQYFYVPSAVATESLILYLNSAGSAVEQKRYPNTFLNTLLSSIAAQPGGEIFSLEDDAGFSVLDVQSDGSVRIPVLAADVVKTGTSTQQYEDPTSGGGVAIGLAIVDDTDSVLEEGTARGLRHHSVEFGAIHGPLNLWHELRIQNSESILLVGDSYTASFYTLKDKAFISLLSAMSPYRIQNFGISGDDATDMDYRVVNKSVYTAGNLELRDMAPRFAIIFDYTNSAPFRGADLTYWQENLSRLVESLRAEGVEPIMATEFLVTPTEMAVQREVARRYGLRFIDNATDNYELGNLTVGPFFQGHPGTRTNGVMWLQTFLALESLPRPDKSIKIFRRRAGFTVGTIADLLYTDRLDRVGKWKELTVAHQRLADSNEQYYEELAGANVYTQTAEADEYQNLQIGQAVAFADYALIEVILPGTALTIDDLELTLPGATGATVYARDWLDTTADLAAGVVPTTPDYLAKWNLPRGAWKSLAASYSGAITVSSNALRGVLSHDRLTLMVFKAGGFSLTGLLVRYRGPLGKGLRAPIAIDRPKTTGAELLAKLTCAAADMGSWTVAGAPTNLVPMDNYNSPRDPANSAAPVAGVCVISATDKIGQTVTLTSPGTDGKRFRLEVFARYFPKAFLDNSAATYPAAQVIDRTSGGHTFTADSLITRDTNDFRTLLCEWATGASIPAVGGVELKEFACLSWRRIWFEIAMPAVPLGSTSITWRLSCPDGQLQIAKASIKEIA